MGNLFFSLISLALHLLPAWIVPLAAKAGIAGWPYLADLWVVRPQLRLILLILPKNFSHPRGWPGPISGPLLPEHRILFSIFYAVAGCINIWLVRRQYPDKSTRPLWMVIHWAAVLLFMELVAFLMVFFGALPNG